MGDGSSCVRKFLSTQKNRPRVQTHPRVLPPGYVILSVTKYLKPLSQAKILRYAQDDTFALPFRSQDDFFSGLEPSPCAVFVLFTQQKSLPPMFRLAGLKTLKATHELY